MNIERTEQNEKDNIKWVIRISNTMKGEVVIGTNLNFIEREIIVKRFAWIIFSFMFFIAFDILILIVLLFVTHSTP